MGHLIFLILMKFQSTLPRRERHAYVCGFSFYFKISIHAPAKGATHRFRHWRYSTGFQSTLPRRERLLSNVEIKAAINISIHAPAKGATTSFHLLTTTQSFQSTLPRRERHKTVKKRFDNYGISIHAPAKGATLNLLMSGHMSMYFNPRSREGSDINHKHSHKS